MHPQESLTSYLLSDSLPVKICFGQSRWQRVSQVSHLEPLPRSPSPAQCLKRAKTHWLQGQTELESRQVWPFLVRCFCWSGTRTQRSHEVISTVLDFPFSIFHLSFFIYRTKTSPRCRARVF